MIDLDRLSLRERAAQLVFPRLGSNMPPPVTASEDLDRFERTMDAVPIGGLIVFNGRHPEITGALGRLQQRSDVPLLVSSDMERGVGQQIRGATVFPHAMAFGAARDDALLEHSARVQAREALACGIHITHSPVADVNRDPRNPIIATRAFSTEPDEAARFVRAYIRGAKSEGILTTAKHFPGHGNTSRDSHEEMPIVLSSRDELRAFDLVPFAAAIEEGVDLIMTAHLLYPALDTARPATLSRAILRDLLRDEMGFDGVVVTDSLLMGAIRRSHEDAGAQAAALVEAGVDILLDFPDPAAAVNGIVEAVDQGRLDPDAVNEAARRVLELKDKMIRRHGDRVFREPESVHPDVEIGSEEHATLARNVARAAIRVDGEAAGRIPIDRRSRLLTVLIKPHHTRLDADVEPLEAAIRSRFPAGRYYQIGPDADEKVYEEVRRRSRSADEVLVALVVKPAAWHKFGLLDRQSELVADLVTHARPILISLGSPHILANYERAAVRLCSYSDVAVSQDAVAAILAGE